MDEICTKCENYINITFLGRTVECCGANMDVKNCPMKEELYNNSVYLCPKTELCKLTGLKIDKLLRILCRAEFAHVKRFKKDKAVYFSVTPKDVDELKKFK